MSTRSIAANFTRKRPLTPYELYWRTVPVRRLVPLLLAVFCLFGMIGCFADLLDFGQKPFVPVFVWSLFSGLIAVVVILAFFRDRRWMVGALVFWLAGSALWFSCCNDWARTATPQPNTAYAWPRLPAMS